MLVSALLFTLQSVTPGVYTPEPIGQQTPPRAEQPIAPPAPGSIEQVLEDRFNLCMDKAVEDPSSAIIEANIWMGEGGSFHARHCIAFAYSRQQNWNLATAEFEKAAREAAGINDPRAGNLWAQAGNAALAGGNALRAISFFDTALARSDLSDAKRGEIHLDKARALVAQGLADNAAAEFARVHELVPEDPLGWLLSATLARRQGNLERALADITVAATLAPQDADIALEAGNIAVSSGDYAAARKNWQQAVAIKKDSQAANTAREYLLRLDALEAEAATP
ncbi:tetratricopeptide repeat protein [Sphingorhabdus sp. Alg239-R122]|uniref:tetratricopeptide repeat protein n=1 Tax=Sphingorhabdus sp. Alg239-R122 TaxID=2305989 RepID=UPI0013D8FFB1|nr:tetratricopeptide repeat protein [Sphingorhabdus sp. Alg239-R122]